MQILKGHTSPETAYVVDDYPYGFRLRCKIRYWLEYKAKQGVRLVSQTTNPKRPGEVWNKPKPSTYCRFGGCMFLNDEGHVKWSGLSEYSTGKEADEWRKKFGEGCHPEAVDIMNRWTESKLAYDAKRDQEAAAQGVSRTDLPLDVGVTEGFEAFAKSASEI